MPFRNQEETWIHHYTPETKEQSKQWTDSSETEEGKVGLSANKVMATVFKNSHGIFDTEYLEKSKTITGVYYEELLE